MNLESVHDRTTVGETVTNVPNCVWVKITQLLGEVSCYLLPVHEGPHCSVDWMEWT
jgi:hypothetical protein